MRSSSLPSLAELRWVEPVKEEKKKAVNQIFEASLREKNYYYRKGPIYKR
jgi:hypothetical protein